MNSLRFSPINNSLKNVYFGQYAYLMIQEEIRTSYSAYCSLDINQKNKIVDVFHNLLEDIRKTQDQKLYLLTIPKISIHFADIIRTANFLNTKYSFNYYACLFCISLLFLDGESVLKRIEENSTEPPVNFYFYNSSPLYLYFRIPKYINISQNIDIKTIEYGIRYIERMINFIFEHTPHSVDKSIVLSPDETINYIHICFS